MRPRKWMLLNLILFISMAPLAGCLSPTGWDELEDEFEALGEGLVDGWTNHGPSSGWGAYSVGSRDSTATATPDSQSVPDSTSDGRSINGS
jgi:hypothetical protein